MIKVQSATLRDKRKNAHLSFPFSARDVEIENQTMAPKGMMFVEPVLVSKHFFITEELGVIRIIPNYN